jgi:Uma2 family endonuclease
MSVVQAKKPLVLFPMTSDQFCALPISKTVKLELLDGEVTALTRPTCSHQYFVGQLAVAIFLWIKPSNRGRLLPDTLMTLDSHWTPTPDLAYIARRHLKRVKEKRIEGPVDLAVEVLSSDPEVDRETKFKAYARFGVKWYWIVDLKQRVLGEYELTNKTYGAPVLAAFDEPFQPRLFPGLVIDLASLEW